MRSYLEHLGAFPQQAAIRRFLPAKSSDLTWEQALHRAGVILVVRISRYCVVLLLGANQESARGSLQYARGPSVGEIRQILARFARWRLRDAFGDESRA